MRLQRHSILCAVCFLIFLWLRVHSPVLRTILHWKYVRNRVHLFLCRNVSQLVTGRVWHVVQPSKGQVFCVNWKSNYLLSLLGMWKTKWCFVPKTEEPDLYPYFIAAIPLFLEDGKLQTGKILREELRVYSNTLNRLN